MTCGKPKAVRQFRNSRGISSVSPDSKFLSTRQKTQPVMKQCLANHECRSWWLNLACAHRDGIVGSTRETPTKGKYGVAALPLLTGREEVYFANGTIRYMKEGSLSDMHVSLLSQVGTTIRILRGHQLKSPLAPRAGIRYDGLLVMKCMLLMDNTHTPQIHHPPVWPSTQPQDRASSHHPNTGTSWQAAACRRHCQNTPPFANRRLASL